ncbi:unnamed protein product [Durusdinium trenchii]|uniref:Uncharacterized protein n=2 Tax=Durusdinium trenchii TaxID=1381693 RepID=A0ABP0L9F7_9DINO
MTWRSAMRDVSKLIRETWHTPLFLGVVLCSVGSLGLLRQLVILLMMIPMEVWVSLALLQAGLLLIGTEVLKELLARQELHQLPRELMRRSMQMGQRLSILAYDVAETREEVRIVLSGVSPTFANVMCSSNLLEAATVVYDRVRQSFGYTNDANAQDRFTAAIGWLQRPQLMICFEDQLRCCALARQALHGDAPVEPSESKRRVVGGLAALELQSWQSCRGMGKVEAEGRLVQELTEKDPTFRKVVPPEEPEAQELPLNDFVQVFLELLEFRLPRDLDDRALRYKKRAFVTSLVATMAWRRLLMRRLVPKAPIVQAVSSIGLSLLTTYLGLLHFGLPASIYARLTTSRWLRALRERLRWPGAAGRLLRWLLQLLMPPLRRPLMISIGPQAPTGQN